MDVKYHVEKCLIPKLSKNYDDSDHHAEYEAREADIQTHFELVLIDLKLANLMVNRDIAAEVLAAILILYYDLLTKGPWASNRLKAYANRLNAQCDSLFDVKAADMLKNDLIFVKAQEIFDECMKALNLKLTANEFKKYPSLVEVYFSLIESQDFKKVEVNIMYIPISLCIIDDSNLEQKKKGLECCRKLLICLQPKEFDAGNYYEVIHASVKRAYDTNDVELTALAMDCFQQILRLVLIDSDFKTTAADELFTNVLERLETEANLHRKAAYFSFMRYLIETNNVNCVGRKKFLTVISYNLDVCCNTGVDEIMLLPVVVCLEEWIKHCWCAWRLDTGQCVLSALIKVLYACKEDLVERIVKLTAALITLCTNEEKQRILAKLQETQTPIEQFNNRLNLIHKHILVN